MGWETLYNLKIGQWSRLYEAIHKSEELEGGEGAVVPPNQGRRNYMGSLAFLSWTGGRLSPGGDFAGSALKYIIRL